MAGGQLVRRCNSCKGLLTYCTNTGQWDCHHCAPATRETGIKSKECRMCLDRFVADDGQNICKKCQREVDEREASNVTELGPHEYMTVDEMLAVATRDHGMSEAMLMGYSKDDGKIIIMSSQLTRAEANFMLDRAKFYALDLEE